MLKSLIMAVALLFTGSVYADAPKKKDPKSATTAPKKVQPATKKACPKKACHKKVVVVKVKKWHRHHRVWHRKHVWWHKHGHKWHKHHCYKCPHKHHHKKK